MSDKNHCDVCGKQCACIREVNASPTCSDAMICLNCRNPKGTCPDGDDCVMEEDDDER